MRNFPRVLLLSIFGAFLLSSCQEDEKPIDNSSQIIGYWKYSVDLDTARDYNIYYTFLEDGKYDSFTAYVNTKSNEVIGYNKRLNGTYTLFGDQLVTQTTEIYHVPASANTSYLPIEELVKVDDNYSMKVKVEFTNEKMTWIYPPCGPLESCIGYQEFTRSTPLEF